MDNVTFRNCTVVHYPWSSQGQVVIRQYGASGEVVYIGQPRVVRSKEELAEKLLLADSEATALSPSGEFYHLAEPASVNKLSFRDMRPPRRPIAGRGL